MDTKEPRLEELDTLSWERFNRPFVELDVDYRNELRQELEEENFNAIQNG